MSITNIFFDFDGVLLDSIAAHEQAFKQAFFNFKIENEKFNYISGRSSKSLVKEFLNANKIFEDELIASIVKEKQKIVRSEIEESLPIFDNEIEILVKLSKEFNLSIVSSSTNYLINKFIIKYNLKNIFVNIVSEENTFSSKPNPEPYLLALKVNKVDSNKSLAIEDSEMGIKAAYDAGIKTIKFNPHKQKNYFGLKLEDIECLSYNDIYDFISEYFT